jgi:hypothetical protein
MSFRIFKRATWQRAASWPNGFEPLATPMDTCRTLCVCYSREEAVEFCDDHNEKWRKHSDRITYKTATPKQIETYYTSPRYEWTEV